MKRPSLPGASLKHAARLRRIVAVLARYGFRDAAERAGLGRFLIGRLRDAELEHLSVAERLRLAFEELGPTFVKLGQLLSQRPDLVPAEFINEFKKLQDHVPSVSYSEIEIVLTNHFGDELRKIFSSIDPVPLGSASIAQVHRAVLTSGEKVVLKVQKPGIEETIAEDLGIVRFIADVTEKYLPETRLYNLKGIVEEFDRSLNLETNFVVEANNIRKFSRNFAGDPHIKIPHVMEHLTGRKVLVMEELEGMPLSHWQADAENETQTNEILRMGLRCYLKMVFEHGLFHGDLHAGNIFVMPNHQIGLIDFGLVGRLNRKTQTAISNMLLALAEEDYDRLAYLYVDLAPYTNTVDVDRLAKQLRDLIAPYFGLRLRHVNIGKILLETTGIAAQHKLQLPSELVLFFKSVVTIEGMGNIISKDFDFLSNSLEFASELILRRYEPQKIAKEMGLLVRDLQILFASSPRQVRQVLRKINAPDFAIRVDWVGGEDFKKTVETSSNLIFLGLVIGSLILSAALIATFKPSHDLWGLPTLSLVCFALASLLGLVAFYNYIKR